MQPILIDTNQPNTYSSYRPAKRYRRTLELSDPFIGLEEGFSRFDLLLLVKRVGKEAGFTPRMIQLLEYYLAIFTRDIDWEEGRPIVYQQLSKTALDLGVSEGQIQKLEKQLFEIGAIGYVDSGNCRRYGLRNSETGRIEYAFGVDLSPLGHLKSQLEEKLHEKQFYMRAWQETKRNISTYRRQIRALLLEWQEEGANQELVREFEQAYQPIALQLRTHIRLKEMQSLLERHVVLHQTITEMMGVGDNQLAQQRLAQQNPNAPSPIKTAKGRSTNIIKEAHKEYNNQSINICSQDGQGVQRMATEPPKPHDLITSSGLPHVTLKQAKGAASEQLRDFFPIDSDAMTWDDLVFAADRLRREYQISQASWGEACQLLGRTGAALCLLITDRAVLREVDPVRQPAAYFRGMVSRARGGELRLHNSIFGLLS